MSYCSIVIRHRYISNNYLCYDSFKEPHWFWGPKRLSEKFTLRSKIMKRLLVEIPEGKEYWLKESDSNSLYIGNNNYIETNITPQIINLIRGRYRNEHN